MKIFAFAATSSTKSINKQLVSYAASPLKDEKIEILDIGEIMPEINKSR